MKAFAPTHPHRSPATSPGRLHILVKEAGSPQLTAGSADNFDETVVIAQMRGEAPVRFAARAIERIHALGHSGHRLSAATLQTGPRYDAATNVARRSILVALVGEGSSRGGMSEVLLEAPSDAGREGSSELLALVGDLLQLPECDALPVRLRFQGLVEPSAEADSGVFWSVPRRHAD